MVILWQAVLSDGRVLTGHAQNRSDFLDALNDIGVNRHEVSSVDKIGRYLGKGFLRARVDDREMCRYSDEDAVNSALYPEDYSKYIKE